MRKLALALILLLGVTLAAAPSKTPEHPLSQIHPVDTDFNMSNRNIFNVSILKMNNGVGSDGIWIDGKDIRDSGNNHILRLDTSTGEYRLVGADLDVNQNNISGFFSSGCAAGEAIQQVKNNGSYSCINLGSSTEDRYVNETGDTMSGILDMGGNDIQNIGKADGVDLENPGPGIIVNSNDLYELGENGTGNFELNNSESFNVSGLNLTGRIDMNGNTITNVPPPVDGDDAVNKSYVDDSDDTISDDQDLSEVLNQGNKTGGTDIDLDGGELVDSTGTATLGGGDVEVPDGNLKAGANLVTTIGNTGGTSGFVSFKNTEIREDNSQNIELANGKVEIPDGNLSISGGDALLRDGSSGDPALAFTTAGDVGIYRDSGSHLGFTYRGSNNFEVRGSKVRSMVNFGVNGNNIVGVGGTTDADSGALRLANGATINWRSSEDDANFGFTGTAAETVDIRDTSGNDVARLKDGGNVEIPNGNLDVTGANDASVTANELVANTDDDSDNGLTIQRASSSGRAQIRLEDESSNNLWRFGTTGSGNSKFTFWDGSNNVMHLNQGGNVEIPNGNLDVKKNRIQNVVSTSSGDAVNQSYVDDNDDTVADDQNLDEINGSAGVGNTEHKITIENGEDAVIKDYFEADTDNQDLSDVLSNGNSAGSNNIDMSSNSISDVNGLTLKGGSSSMDLTMNVDDGSDTQVMSWENQGSKEFDMVHWVTRSPSELAYRDSSGNEIIRMDTNQNVKLPNGNLNITNHNLEINANGGGITWDSDNNQRTLALVKEKGTNKWGFRYNNENIQWRSKEDANGAVLDLKQNGNIKVPNGNLNVSGATSSTKIAVTGDQGQSLEIKGNVDSYSPLGTDAGVIESPSSRSIAIEVDGNQGQDRFAVTDDQGDENFNVRRDGDANIPNGKLDVNSPSNTGGSLDVGGAVNVDGNIDTNGNSVTSNGGEMCIGDQCT